MSFSSFGSMIYCILHFHTCTIVYFPIIGVHLVLFISCYPVLFLYFICICMFLFYLSYTLCFCTLSVLFLYLYTYFHIKLYCTSCSCNCLYFHRIARLCFSYHIILYTFRIQFLCVYFSFSFIFMSANTLEADLGNNWVYLKVLSLYETVISIC